MRFEAKSNEILLNTGEDWRDNLVATEDENLTNFSCWRIIPEADRPNGIFKVNVLTAQSARSYAPCGMAKSVVNPFNTFKEAPLVVPKIWRLILPLGLLPIHSDSVRALSYLWHV